jgi:peptidoglycan/LPS O-acetylase OafA/YrhL
VKHEASKTLDRMGIFFSGACALHCLLMPILPFFLPTLTIHFEFEWLHYLLLLLIVPTAWLSFYRHNNIPNKSTPLKFGLSGVLFLIVAVAGEKLLSFEVENLEVILTTIGSVMLICGHFLNIRYAQRCFQ